MALEKRSFAAAPLPQPMWDGAGDCDMEGASEISENRLRRQCSNRLLIGVLGAPMVHGFSGGSGI